MMCNRGNKVVFSQPDVKIWNNTQTATQRWKGGFMHAEKEVVQADFCIGRIGQGSYPLRQCLYNHSAR